MQVQERNLIRYIPLWTALLMLSVNAGATSVVALSFTDLCLQSSTIVEGRVSTIQTRTDPGDGLIWTTVTIHVVDVLHGNPADTTLTLEFMGGSHNGRTLAVSEMQVPALGENGIYFVHDASRRMVHPLTGWSQGHFVVHETSAGDRHVRTSRGDTVTAITEVASQRGLSHGVAAGVETASADAPEAQALTLDTFKNRIRSIAGS